MGGMIAAARFDPSAIEEVKWCGKCWVIRLLGIRCSPDPETKYDKAAQRRSHTAAKGEQAVSPRSFKSAFVRLCPSAKRRRGLSLEKPTLVYRGIS